MTVHLKPFAAATFQSRNPATGEIIKSYLGHSTREVEDKLEKARDSLGDARDAFDDAREAVALLMNLPPAEAAQLQPRGGLRQSRVEPCARATALPGRRCLDARRARGRARRQSGCRPAHGKCRSARVGLYRARQGARRRLAGPQLIGYASHGNANRCAGFVRRLVTLRFFCGRGAMRAMACLRQRLGRSCGARRCLRTR